MSETKSTWTIVEKTSRQTSIIEVVLKVTIEVTDEVLADSSNADSVIGYLAKQQLKKVSR